MATPILISGAEAGVVTVGATGLTPVWTAVVGTAPTISTTTYRNGLRAYRFNPAAATSSLQKNISTTRLVGRFAFRFATHPDTDNTILIRAYNTNGSIVFRYDTGADKIEVIIGAGVAQASSITISQDVWYLIDFDINTSGATATCDWRIWVDGGTPTAQTQATSVQASASITTFDIGNPSTPNSTYDLFIDDIILSYTAADYPFGDGKVLGFSPNIDGTHSFVANDFLYNATGAAISSSATNVYTYIDDVPITDGADWINQAVIDATGWIEVGFADATDTSNPRGVQVSSAQHSATTTANKAGANILDGTTLAVFYSATSDISQTSLIYNSIQYAVAPSSATQWTQAKLNALKFRWGYSTDANPDAYLDSVMMEVEWAVSGTTAVSDTIKYLWNNRKAISDTYKPIWNVRKAISDTQQYLWKVRAKTGIKTNAYSWNVRKAISDTFKPIWNSVSHTLDTIKELWNVRKAVPDTVKPIWNVQAETHWISDGTTSTGNWSDTNHWSNGLPTSTKSAIFDAASFDATGRIVTVDAVANCLNMDWTGATNSPTLAGASNLIISGNATFLNTMTCTASGQLRISATVGNTCTLTTNGLSLASFVAINKNNHGTLILADALIAYAIWHYAGIINTNGKTVTITELYNDQAQTATRTLTLGASTINCAGWSYTGSNLTVTTNTSTINCSGNFAGGSIKTYNILNLTGATRAYSGDNDFDTFTLDSTKTQAVTFAANSGITASTITLSGSAGHVHTLDSGTEEDWLITKVGGGTVFANYINIDFSHAAPEDTFYAYSDSVDGGHNEDWGFYTALNDALVAMWNVRKSILDTIKATWNVKKSIPDTIKALWNIRDTVTAGTFKPIWNVRKAIADTQQYIWNVLTAIAVSDTIQFVWNVRSKVSDTVQEIWNVRKSIPDTVKYIWNNRAKLTDTLKPIWNVRSKVSDSVKYLWNIRDAVSDTQQYLWNARAKISDTFTGSWNVRKSVSDSVKYIWNSRKVITDTTKYIWNVLANVTVQDTIVFVWNVRAKVTDTLSPIWNVRAKISDTMIYLWSVRTVVPVKTIQYLWNARAKITDSLVSLWNTRAKVTDTIQVIWNVLSTAAVQDTISFAWNVRQKITDTIPSSWAVRKAVVDTVQFVYNVRSIVGDTFKGIWNTRSKVTDSIKFIWGNFLRHLKLIISEAEDSDTVIYPYTSIDLTIVDTYATDSDTLITYETTTDLTIVSTLSQSSTLKIINEETFANAEDN